MSIEGSCRRLNARPTAAAAAACATTSLVTRRTGAARRTAGRLRGRRRDHLPGSAALTAHLRPGVPSASRAARAFRLPVTSTSVTPAAGELQSGPWGSGGLPGIGGVLSRVGTVGSAPLLSASHNAALSATGLRPACSGGSYRLDMTGQREPRQNTSRPAATIISAPVTAAGRHSAAVIVTWPTAVTPGAAPPPGTAPGETPAAPPAVAEPACETAVIRAAPRTSEAASGRHTATAMTTPKAAISSPASRRARRLVAMTAARLASAARASAPASGTRSWPLTRTTLAGNGAGAGVDTRAQPCLADTSTSPAPAAPRARPSAYSRRDPGCAPAGLLPADTPPRILLAPTPPPRPGVTARSAPAAPRRNRSGRRYGRRPRTGPP